MKKKKKQIIALLALCAVVIAGVAYNYTFNSEHRNIANEDATVTLTASELYSNFLNDEAQATTTYLDKVVQIHGNISAVEEQGVVLNDQIQVSFNVLQIPILNKDTAVIIKGRCVGYDDLLETVKIDQAILIKNEN